MYYDVMFENSVFLKLIREKYSYCQKEKNKTKINKQINKQTNNQAKNKNTKFMRIQITYNYLH